jgi:HNH endonuclease
MPNLPAPARVITRILSNTDRDASGCLVSRYSAGSHGYAQIGWAVGGKTVVNLCHRVLWHHFYGPIPPDMTVDHLCRNRLCVDIDHYRLLPNLENARRTEGRGWPLGQCRNGHDNERYWYQPTNGTKGHCKACKSDVGRRYRARKKLYASNDIESQLPLPPGIALRGPSRPRTAGD